MTEQQAAAGWYPDGSGSERYWDGSSWTEQMRSPSAPPALVAESPEKNGVLNKLGSAVKRAADDRRTAREDAARDHAEREAEAGRLVTSGVFGTSTIEIYEGGLVRVAESREGRAGAAPISKSTPFERLRSISFAAPESAQPDSTANSQIEGAVMQAMSGLMKGGKILAKGTAVGLATTGIAHIASNVATKTNLVIATDKMVHTLTNQQHNGLFNASRKEHNAVAEALVEAGNAVLGITVPSSPAIAQAELAPVASASSQPSLSDRIRELSGLHQDGILSDEEFSSAKAKLLSGL